MNIASPSTTWFGGTFCVDIAFRKKPITTTIRTKEVVIIKMPGAIVTIVSNANTCSVDDTSAGLFAVPTSTLTLGITGAASAKFAPNKKNNVAQVKMRKA